MKPHLCGFILFYVMALCYFTTTLLTLLAMEV